MQVHSNVSIGDDWTPGKLVEVPDHEVPNLLRFGYVRLPDLADEAKPAARKSRKKAASKTVAVYTSIERNEP